MIKARHIAIAVLSAIYTSAWWSLAMFGFPGKEQNTGMIPVIVVAVLGSIGILFCLGTTFTIEGE